MSIHAIFERSPLEHVFEVVDRRLVALALYGHGPRAPSRIAPAVADAAADRMKVRRSMYRCLSVISELGMLAEDLINMIA
jgi:hypothetical protein